MKTAIVYFSVHRGNTRKLLEAIAAKEDVRLINIAEEKEADLSSYDRIGLASGIYYNNFAKQIINFADTYLPEGKDVFYIYTHGAPVGNFLKGIDAVVKRKQCKVLGAYHCLGFDTFGPFKLVGGLAKGHPTAEETAAAVSFYESLNK